ncbi:hypothetical protein C0J52_26562 [Blattella germanica]|nr:hypothetical protein C0J52_26562 [Blattella germanica]
MLPDDRDYGTMLREGPSRGFYESEAVSNSRAAWERDTNHYVHAVNKREGSRPIFQREEIIRATRLDSVPPVEEHRRVVAIVDEAPGQSQGGGTRFESPTRYSDVRPRSRESYYPSSNPEPPPRDYSRSSREYDRGHGPSSGFEPRERSRDDHFDRRSEDLRHELDLRRRDERYPREEGRRYERNLEYRGGGGGDSDRGSSDLRMRINEKRSDRHDDRESSHHRMIDMDRDRDRDQPPRGMMQPSPPGSPSEGRPVDDGKIHSGGSRPMMSHRGRPGNRYHDGPPERFDEPPDFPNQRSDRFHHYNKNWEGNPEYVPKGRGYFEHDNREFVPMRGRGRGMFRGNMIRGRGIMRGRPYRGGPRGFMGRGRRGIYIPSKSSPQRHLLPPDDFDLLDDDRDRMRRSMLDIYLKICYHNSNTRNELPLDEGVLPTGSTICLTTSRPVMVGSSLATMMLTSRNLGWGCFEWWIWLHCQSCQGVVLFVRELIRLVNM